MSERTCSVSECGKTPRSKSAELCPMHYHRAYRHGDVNFTANAIDTGVRQKRAYRTVAAHGHPLAMKNGRVYEHRKVLYDAIGPGEHPCRWCGAVLRWSTKGDPAGIVPDHLNGRGGDNRPENLAASCLGCNSGRSAQARSMVLRRLGAWSGNDTINRLKVAGRREMIDPEMRALDLIA